MSEDLSKLSDEELQARLESIEKKRAEKLAANTTAIRRKAREESVKLAELEAEFGTVGVDIEAVFSPNDGRMVVVKRPKPITYNRIQNKMVLGKLTDEETTSFVYANLVYPTKSEFEAICDGCAEMLAAAAGAATKLGGAGRIDLEGK